MFILENNCCHFPFKKFNWKKKFTLTCREVFSALGARKVAGWAVIRTRYFSLHVFQRENSYFRKAMFPYVFHPPIFSPSPFFSFYSRTASKAVEVAERPTTSTTSPGERNISSLPPLFASTSMSSTKIEMQGNWKMEYSNSGNSFVPFVRGVSSRNWVELRESNANRIKLLEGKTRTIGAPSHYLVTRSIFVIELIFRALSISAKSFRELGAAYRRRGDTFTNVLSSLARPENSTFP